VDDLEKDWTWTKPFDFIFSRVMAGSFTDYQAFVDKSFAYVITWPSNPPLDPFFRY
jgi:hypothetical protein